MGKKKRKGRMEGGGPGLQEESGLCISDAESSFSPLFFLSVTRTVDIISAFGSASLHQVAAARSE